MRDNNPVLLARIADVAQNSLEQSHRLSGNRNL
jgi:hypothetical protein